MKKRDVRFFVGMTTVPSLLEDEGSDHVSTCIFDCIKKEIVPCETIAILAKRITALSDNSYRKMKAVVTHEPPVTFFEGHKLTPFGKEAMKSFRFCVSLELRQPNVIQKKMRTLQKSIDARPRRSTDHIHHFAHAA